VTQLTSTTLILFLATLLVATESRATVFLEDDGTGGDCTTIGTWDAGSKTCTMTIDINDSIRINSPGITLDCAAHKITSPAFGTGVRIPSGANGVTVKDCVISDFAVGIGTAFNNDHFIIDNIVKNYFSRGISIFSGSNITVSNNVVDGDTVPKAAFERGIVVSSGSENKILTNTIFNSVIPITVSRSNGNIISGNIVDTGVFGVGIDGGEYNEITDNDITGQGVFGIIILGSYHTIADNVIHESAGIRVTFVDQLGPTNNNVVKGNIIENGIGINTCAAGAGCDDGILLTAANAQVFSNAFGNGFMDNNTITGNTIRNFPGTGIEFNNVGTNNVVSHNVITDNALGGILLAHRCPSCEYKFMRNDIFNNGGIPFVSVDSETDQNFIRTLLGPLAVDIAGDDGLGNPIGNFWGRVCDDDGIDDDDGDGDSDEDDRSTWPFLQGPPFFIAGMDSNDLYVTDSFPFGVSVADSDDDEGLLPPGCDVDDE